MTNTNKVSSEDMANLAPESLEPTLRKPVVKNKKSGNGWLVFVLIIIIIAVAVLFFLDSTGKINLFGSGKEIVNTEAVPGEWQAVFLSNGQVYFGHLKNLESAYPKLTDIYYLQVQQVPIQPAEPATDEAGVQPAQQTTQQMILVKFGTEIHKPQDEMFINKDHILFYENLQADSQVLKAINDYLKNKPAE
ncbi:MAG: hypothetical protein ABIF17_03090 [Patescibacteria group bacterium]